MTSSVRWVLGRTLEAGDLEAGAVWGRFAGAVWGRFRGTTIALALCDDCRNDLGGWIEYSAFVVYGLGHALADAGRLRVLSDIFLREETTNR